MMIYDTFSKILAIYADVLGGDLLRYVLGAGGTYLVINVLLARRLHRQKIRPDDPPFRQILRELAASLRTVLIFAATGTCIGLGVRSGLMTVYPEVADYGTGYFVLSVVLLVVLHDTWFYWTHRAMHYPPLFRRFHRLHHRSHNPTPFTSYAFDVGEAFVNAVYLPLVLLVLPAHPLALLIFVTHMMLRNALGHCGVEVFPARADGRPLFGWLSSVTHHDLHHAFAGYNLGFYFTWWDKVMGTEHPGYIEAFARVAPRLPLPRIKLGLWSVAVLGALTAAPSDAEPLRGHYASPGLGLIVGFAGCAGDPSKTCGTLKWTWNPSDARHARIGDVILQDLRQTRSGWEGALLVPESGRTFRGILRRRGAHQLELRGCAGPLCQTQIWHSTAELRRLLSRF